MQKLTSRDQRRRAGIPDSDKRPWIIARPAAELARREQVKARLQAEQEERERRERELREKEINEWGHKAVGELRRMQSRGELSRRRPVDDLEEDL